MSKWIYNNDTVSHTWEGQVVASSAYYQIQPIEEAKFAASDTLVDDIVADKAIMSESNDSTGHISGHSQQIDFLKGNLPARVTPTPSQYNVSLRIEGDTWSCPANTNTTHYVALNDDYEIRGAEFQFVNGKAGDYVEVWVTDKDGILYPAGTRLTQYVNKFCVYEHEPNTQAWVADLVDDDTSDEVPSVLYLEFIYHNVQTAGSDAVTAVVNFWMYKRV